MDFFVNNWVLILVAFSSGAMLLWPTVGGFGGSLTVSDAVTMMNREKAVVVDVSEPKEFAQGHIGGAKNVPLGGLEKDLAAAVKNKETPVIFTCPTGARAGRAAQIAKKLGYTKAQGLAGGTNGWRTASMPVEKAA
jgi:rhodanese-related sulfurtransferase